MKKEIQLPHAYHTEKKQEYYIKGTIDNKERIWLELYEDGWSMMHFDGENTICLVNNENGELR